MTNDDVEPNAAKLTNDLITLVERIQPLVDASSGFRKNLEANGWSSAAAETAALAMLVGMIQKAFA